MPRNTQDRFFRASNSFPAQENPEIRPEDKKVIKNFQFDETRGLEINDNSFKNVLIREQTYLTRLT